MEFNYRVESSVSWPVTYLAETGCESSECFKGLHPEIFHLMQYDFNFTYTLIANNDPIGYELPNGTWTGIIGNYINFTKCTNFDKYNVVIQKF